MKTEYLATLSSAIRHFARERAGAIAYAFEGRETTFGDFDRHTDRVAQALLADGVKAGDRIAYVGKNSDHYFELFFGAAKMGAVITPVSWRLAGPEIQYIVSHCDATLVFVGTESSALVRGLLPALPLVRRAVAMEGGEADWPAYPDWRDACPDTPPTHEAQPNDVVLQLYTSGTTGRPKGVMLMHRNLTCGTEIALHDGADWSQWSDDDVSLVAMPVAHIGGSGWGVRGVLVGCKGVVAREFDPSKVLDYIEHDRISKLFMVPAAMQIVLRDPRARQVDYSRLKHMLYGSSPIPAALLREGMAVFGCGFVQQYGMTETTGTIVALPPEDHTPADVPRMRAAGKAMPGSEVAVVGPDGRRLPAGEVGEVVIRSPQNMAGYWKQEEDTARTLDADGWLRSGDAGYMDADGYLYIHDRVKDMIISGGENIYPAEVESAIYGHPAVADVAVIGVPDERWGEAVKAMVVLRPGVAADVDGILGWARERIAGFKVPKSIDFIDAMPRNPAGKLLRRALREPYWVGCSRRVN
ncbi:long-chain-fatty-acid--CoA ligase [Pseudomonas sp. ATCC 13867]|uniref:fatty acid--CoA ligase n=1 Tax=Pseudomonas sp. ATCC 13867 TaxID=1294143 RepID=UPI0002C4F24B|nr:fatty acid--CoA ligase [Pseudomonas sp. ATCC 13867]AGI26787.1 long-chain-fatty-acid--CoA ligase [Pseudomonas sp. ATCC 13867]